MTEMLVRIFLQSLAKKRSCFFNHRNQKPIRTKYFNWRGSSFVQSIPNFNKFFENFLCRVCDRSIHFRASCPTHKFKYMKLYHFLFQCSRRLYPTPKQLCFHTKFCSHVILERKKSIIHGIKLYKMHRFS